MIKKIRQIVKYLEKFVIINYQTNDKFFNIHIFIIYLRKQRFIIIYLYGKNEE